MPVINIPYVAKGAAHTPIKPIQPIKPMPSATVDARSATTGRPVQRPSQDAILAAMQSAMSGPALRGAGFGAVTDLNNVPEPPPVRSAVDSINDYTRARMREESFMRAIMPPVPIDNPAPTYFESPSRLVTQPADRIAYMQQQKEADLAAQEAVRIQLPLGPRQIIRDVNKKTQE